MENTWQKGIQTQREECRDVDLSVQGEFPTWLDGTFIGNGPGQFEVGEKALEHWFDAFAMLRRIEITDGTAQYSNRFIRSEDFKVAREEDRVRRSLPGTPASGSALRRLYQALAGGLQDNPSIGVTRMDETLYAVTESPVGLEINPQTLETTGRRDLTTGLESDITLGHTHFEGNTQWGMGATFGSECAYTVFRRSEGNSPEPISRLQFDEHPPYIHAFALTEQYAVIPESCFGVNFRKLLFDTARGGTFLDAFASRDRQSQFHIINRATGERTAAVSADPFFIYHFANAYEESESESGSGSESESIVVDCVRFDDITAITDLTVENLRSEDPDLPEGDFVRYRLPLAGGTAERERLFRGPVEFPTINYGAYNGRSYQYAYLAATDTGGLPTALAKVDVEQTTAQRWSEDGVHPGEALFVPAPEATAEDDGVLLSLAVDGYNDRSLLLCLDAETMTEQARAVLPHRVPYGFHGQFYETSNPTRSMA